MSLDTDCPCRVGLEARRLIIIGPRAEGHGVDGTVGGKHCFCSCCNAAFDIQWWEWAFSTMRPMVKSEHEMAPR